MSANRVLTPDHGHILAEREIADRLLVGAIEHQAARAGGGTLARSRGHRRSQRRWSWWRFTYRGRRSDVGNRFEEYRRRRFSNRRRLRTDVGARRNQFDAAAAEGICVVRTVDLATGRTN